MRVNRIAELQRFTGKDETGKPIVFRLLLDKDIVYALAASAEYAEDIDMADLMFRSAMDVNYENNKLRRLFFEPDERGAYLCTLSRKQLLPNVLALIEKQFALEALQEV